MSKTVLITGSARRLGRAFALEFAQKGWNIVLHHHASPERAEQTLHEILSYNVRAIILKGDLRVEQDIVRFMDEAFEKMGSIDVLVNNAGVFHDPYTLENTSTELWDSVNDVNTKAQFLTAREFVRKTKIVESDNGILKRIINIASLGGIETWKKRISYNVSKSGSIHLTKSLAVELAPSFSVNCICPGAIIQPDDFAEQDAGLIPEKRIPMLRYGTASDIFDALYFFSTCSPYITGQIMIIDGGYHLSR